MPDRALKDLQLARLCFTHCRICLMICQCTGHDAAANVGMRGTEASAKAISITSNTITRTHRNKRGRCQQSGSLTQQMLVGRPPFAGALATRTCKSETSPSAVTFPSARPFPPATTPLLRKGEAKFPSVPPSLALPCLPQ